MLSLTQTVNGQSEVEQKQDQEPFVVVAASQNDEDDQEAIIPSKGHSLFNLLREFQLILKQAHAVK